MNLNKQEQINEYQKKKEALSLEIKKSFKEKHEFFKTYNKLNNNWLDLKAEWEAIDRKEKFLSLPITQVKQTKSRTKSRDKAQSVNIKDINDKAKAMALKSIEKLPLEIRKQILANFKF